MTKEETGYVYILTNPSFKEDWVKIGKSSRPVNVRSKELDNTAVPLPFDIYATLQTMKYNEVEKQIHKQIDRLTDLRIRQNREFFNISAELALEIMRDMANILDDAVICVYKNGKTIVSKDKEEDKKIRSGKKEKKQIRKSFKFSMIGLKVGDEVIFDELKLPVTIVTDDKVEYEGRLWSLSAFTGTFLPVDKQNTSGAYQGAKYFSYNGKTLWQLRLEMEKE